MKRILAMMLCATALVWGGCSEKSSDGIGPDIEHAGGGGSNDDDGYTFIKNVTGYAGSSTSVTSARLKIYRKGGAYYATVTSGNTNYCLCSKNSGYNSSYTGRDPKRKYKYCVKPYTITYYFDL